MMISIIMLDTLMKYWTYIVPNVDDREPVASILIKTLDAVSEITKGIVKSDFEII